MFRNVKKKFENGFKADTFNAVYGSPTPKGMTQ